MNYIAFVTKGLERISRNELTSINGVSVKNVEDKFIRFDFEGNPNILSGLRTVDDIGLIVDEFDLHTGNDEIASFANLSAVEKGLEIIQTIRSLANNFSVTVSIYQNPHFHRDNLQQKIAGILADKLKLVFTPLDHSNIDLRVNIDKSHVFITLKLFSQSLYKRTYEHKSNIGALRSTIAAAMLYELVGDKTNLKVVDNFCGSGTFLCEAAKMRCEVSGGDIESNMVSISKQNLGRLGNVNSAIITQDATHTNWPSKSFDIGVANFPWDKQIEISNISTLLEGGIKEYARILKPEAKVGFISTKPELVLKFMKRYFRVNNLQEIKIGYLGQTPTIQLADVEPLMG